MRELSSSLAMAYSRPSTNMTYMARDPCHGSLVALLAVHRRISARSGHRMVSTAPHTQEAASKHMDSCARPQAFWKSVGEMT